MIVRTIVIVAIVSALLAVSQVATHADSLTDLRESETFLAERIFYGADCSDRPGSVIVPLHTNDSSLPPIPEGFAHFSECMSHGLADTRRAIVVHLRGHVAIVDVMTPNGEPVNDGYGKWVQRIRHDLSTCDRVTFTDGNRTIGADEVHCPGGVRIGNPNRRVQLTWRGRFAGTTAEGVPYERDSAITVWSQ